MLQFTLRKDEAGQLVVLMGCASICRQGICLGDKGLIEFDLWRGTLRCRFQGQNDSCHCANGGHKETDSSTTSNGSATTFNHGFFRTSATQSLSAMDGGVPIGCRPGPVTDPSSLRRPAAKNLPLNWYFRERGRSSNLWR